VFKKPAIFFLTVVFLPNYSSAAVNTERSPQLIYISQDNSADKNSIIEGIFYDRDKPVVIIRGKLYYLGDSFCGGEIIKISPVSVTIRFNQSEKEYSMGDSPCQTRKMEQVSSEEFQQTSEYLDSINSLIKDFTLKHRENKALFESKRNNKERLAISSNMIESIKSYRQQLIVTSVPVRCKRCHLLTIKMFDIAEDAWERLTSGDKEQAKILFNRVLRITQEISVESIRRAGHFW